MNTLPVAAGAAAWAWLAFFAFDTLGEPLVGAAAIGMVFVSLVFAVFALDEDRRIISSRRDEQDGPNRRNR